MKDYSFRVLRHVILILHSALQLFQQTEKTIKRICDKHKGLQKDKEKNNDKERKEAAVSPYVSTVSNHIGKVLKVWNQNQINTTQKKT